MNNKKKDYCNCELCRRKFWNNRTEQLKNINAEYGKHIQSLPYEKTKKLLRLMDRNNNNAPS